MSLEVLDRPDKTLSNGILSRWNGSRTPLNYTFESDIFPVNTIDVSTTIKRATNDTSRLGCIIGTTVSVSTLNIAKDYYIFIDGTNTSLDGVVHRIKEIPTGTDKSIIIDTYVDNPFDLATGIGSIQRYYKGYKAIVKVYVGAPSYHPYTTDQSKPTYLAGTMEVEFNADNKGVGNVRNYIKPDLSTQFDDTAINSHNLWTSFYVEYGEYYDGIPSTSYQKDLLNPCVDFTDFADPSFTNGLTSWLTRPYFGGSDWVTGSGSVSVAMPTGSGDSSYVLYQNKGLTNGNEYTVTIDYTLSNSNGRFNVAILDDIERVLNSENVSNSGVIVLKGNASRDSLTVGIGFRNNIINPNTTITVNSVNIQANDGVTSPCEYNAFAVLGTKQFQDELGGNFGDYLLNTVDQFITPKMLTHFQEVSLFPVSDSITDIYTGKTVYQNFKNYINAIIPSNVFSSSLDGNSVFLEFNTFDNQNNSIDNTRLHIENKSDGVYNVDLDSLSLLDFDNGFCQFVTIPDNTLTDGDFGTYNDANPAGWNMSNIGIGGSLNTVEILSGVYTCKTNANSATGITQGTIYDVLAFDSPINTVIGLDYIIETEIYTRGGDFEPTQRNGGTSMFLGVEGVSDSNITYTEVYSPLDSQGDYEKQTCTTSFTATSTSHKIQLKQKANKTIGFNTGGNWFFENTTFKGPIAYVSEKKPIKLNNECFGYKGYSIRWLNDLGGWEPWKFKQYGTEKESFKKTEIKRDIFTDFDNEFINGSTQYDAISVASRRSITVRSGLLSANDLKVVSQLRRSIKVELLMDSGKWQTVSTKGSSFVILEEEKNMHEISFDIELPDTLIQEI